MDSVVIEIDISSDHEIENSIGSPEHYEQESVAQKVDSSKSSNDTSDSDESVSESEINYFNGDISMPFYQQGKQTLNAKKLFDIIVNRNGEDRFCSKQPMKCEQNATFVVDRSKLSHPEDWHIDDHGSWSNKGNSGCIVTTTMADNGTEGIKKRRIIIDQATLPRKKKERPKLVKGQFLIRTTYFAHGKYPDFKKKTVEVLNYKDTAESCAVIQYFFTGKAHSVSPKKHGNSKSNRKFFHTAPSTMESLKKQASTQKGPSAIFDTVFEEKGGILYGETFSEFPRDVHQIKNVRRKMRAKTAIDDFASLLDLSGKALYIHNLQYTPLQRVVVTTKEVLNDIVQFCTEPSKFAPFCIDTLFNAGSYYISPATYKHLKLVYRYPAKESQPDSYINMPGPALFHLGQDEKQFSYFIFTLRELESDLKNILVVGSDRDKALINGLMKGLPYANFIICKRHMERDIEMKLHELGITGSLAKEILYDVFGKDNAVEKGLVDCDTVDEFDLTLTCLGPKWDEIESEAAQKMGKEVTQFKFFEYFKSFIADDIRHKMLRPVRQKAGFGNNFFYDNNAENLNGKIKLRFKQVLQEENKAGKPNKKASWCDGVRIYKMILDEHRRNVHRAIIDCGPYKLAPEYEHLKVVGNEWVRLSPAARLRRIKQIDPMATLESVTSMNTRQRPASSETGEVASSSQMPKHSPAATDEEHNIQDNEMPSSSSDGSVMGRFADSGLPGLFKTSWENAGLILQHDNGIVNCPGVENGKIVMSLSNPLNPHTVIMSQNESALCCDCHQFNTHSLCAHVFAVAYQLGNLEMIICKWNPNIEKQLQNKLPAKPGRKKNEVQRKRHQPFKRDVTKFSARNKATSEDDTEDDKFVAVFMKDTQALNCYGCGVKIRQSSKDPPPNAPYDVMLRRKEYRAYPQCGTLKFKIAKTKTPAYYHLRKLCVLQKTTHVRAEDIYVPKDVKKKLFFCHRNILAEEFGVKVEEEADSVSDEELLEMDS